MKTTIILLLTVLITLFLVTLASAQPGPPSAPSQAPIDGGLHFWLLQAVDMR